MPATLDALSDGLSTFGLLLIAVLLVSLAWKGKDGAARALVEEKEQALGRLKKTEAHLGLLVEEVKEYAIFQLDTQGRVASWNLGAERILGWRAEDILGQPGDRFYPEEDVLAGKPQEALNLARVLRSVHEETWRVRKDGSRFMASEALTALHDDQGEVRGYTKVTHDLTECREVGLRLQIQARDLEAQMATRTAELQESEARLQGFIRHASVAIAFKGLDGRVLLANRRAEALISMWQTQTPNGSGPGLFPPEVAARIRKEDERVIGAREELQSEASLPLPDGAVRDFLFQKFPLLDAVGHCWGIGVIATDITERKQAEQAHLQHQKLESIGLLAGGIAHDFNNLLGAMSGNLELARLELDGEGPVLAHFRTLEELIGRASSLVEQILAYAGKGKVEVHTLDLNRQVEGMTRLLRASLSTNALLRWEPALALPAIEGDPAQIQQVVMNLVLNASDAVAVQGGTITLRTGMETLGQAVIDCHFPGQALKPGPHLTLEVADNGVGMSAQVQERIFDPFFTTKFAGRGLGLSAVQGILRSHAGGILVSSREGEGTAFKLFFPVAAEPKRPEAPAPPEAKVRFAAYHSAGTVLVVDDEDALRAVAGGALCRLGFEVLEARDGVEALQVFAEQGDRIRLILMDLTMPRMDGEEAFRELRRAGASMPIMLSSGFGQEEALLRFKGKGLAGFLQKPYRLQTLANAVRAALGEDGNGAMVGAYPLPREVVWGREFETGHALVDRQHRGLVDRFNRLVVALRDGGPQEPEEALHQFIGATVAHFGIEEGLMAESGYPEARDHKAVHVHLTTQVQSLAQELNRGLVTLSPPILNFLEGWLLCHIQFEDRHLVYHLKTHSA
jgi:hemerythrin-like metal-binding protein/PAS domain S-box-containing protein